MKRPLISIFSIPKAFTGLAAIQQHNAITSWLQLGQDVEVTLIGDDPGTAEAAQEHGVRHLPDVLRDEFGTPLVNSVFRAGIASSQAPIMCYINADIILLPDFLGALHRVSFRTFLMVGQRWDVPLGLPLQFESPAWRETVRDYVTRNGRLHPYTGIDYFIFTAGWLEPMPDFAVGRTIWDNWIIFRARARGVPVIDATQAITAVHQDHDYEHVKGGANAAWTGPQASRNRSLAADMLYPFTIADATWYLATGSPRRRVRRGALWRQLLGLMAVTFGRNPTVGERGRRLARTLHRS